VGQLRRFFDAAALALRPTFRLLKLTLEAAATLSYNNQVIEYQRTLLSAG
jgi:hypothetical protein